MARYGTENVGEGTVPSLLQRLDRDDAFDRTGPVEQVDAVQFPLVAGGDGDLPVGDLFDLHQIVFQSCKGYFLVSRLGLEENDGPDVVGVVLGRSLQRGARGDGAVDRVFPSVVLPKA